MKFKLIVALVPDHKSTIVVDAAREAGATGATVITSARGEGHTGRKAFFGLDLNSLCDVVLLVVREEMSGSILRRITDAARFDTESGSGIALQIDIEAVAGLATQIGELSAP